MIAVLTLLAIWAAGLGLGRLSALAAGWRFSNWLEELTWQTAVGWVGLSLIFFVLGLAGWLTPEPVWTMLIGFAAVGVIAAFRLVRTVKLPEKWWQLRVAAGLVVAVLVVLTGIVALTPPIGAGMAWDGLMYHLPTIQAWVDKGRIAPIPSIPFSNYPMGLNLLFVPGLMAARPEAAQLVHWSTGVLAASATYLLARRVMAGDWAVLAGLSFWLLPLVQQEATWPMNDLGLVLYASLSLLALLNWLAESSPSWLVAAGLMAGFAASVKVTAVFPVFALSFLVLSLPLLDSQKDWKVVWRTWLGFGLPLFLIGGLWYLKNWVQLGNPFFPFLFDFFGGDFWTEAANERFRLSQVGRGLQLPVLMKTAVLLGGMVALFVLGRLSRVSMIWKTLLAYPVLIGLSWLITESPQSRYLFPVFPIFLVVVWGVTAYGIRYLGIGVRPSWFYLVVITAAILSIGLTFRSRQVELSVGLGLKDQQDYLSRRFYMYPAYEFANSRLPETAKLLIFPEDRTYYLNREYLWGDPISQGVIEYADYATASDLLADLTQRGVTHVVLSQPAFDFFISWEAHNRGLVDYMTRANWLFMDLSLLGATPIFEENGVVILALP